MEKISAAGKDGKQFVLVRPDIIKQARFERQFGDESKTYRGMMLPLMWIESIDGELVPMPNNTVGWEGLLKRVGEDNLWVVLDVISQNQEAPATREEVKN